MSSYNKFVLYLDSALAMENAAVERLQRRVQQTILEDAKQKLQHHLEETKEQQERLRQLITKEGRTPTQEKGKLAISIPPESIRNAIHTPMVLAEQEILESVEDTIVENAEVIGYNLLVQMAVKLNKGDALVLLKQSCEEEDRMFEWLKANAPSMFAKLWSQIDSLH
jgi:ferritin-like metal-binding protein YciE